MWYIINILSCNIPIDGADSRTLYFDVFILFSWYTPEEVRNITTQRILSYERDPYGILIVEAPIFFLWLEFSRKALVILESFLFGVSIFPLSEDASPSIVWTMMFMLWCVLINLEDLASAPYLSTPMNANLLSWLLNIVTKYFRISRGGILILDRNPKG